MVCQECGQREAEVFVKQIVGNKVAQAVLCGPCAAKKGLQTAHPSALLLSLLSGMGFPQPESRLAARPRCPSCGLREADFRDTGRLGCAACYEAFGATLSELLPRIHGFSSHAGKRQRVRGDPASPGASGAAAAGKGSREARSRGAPDAAEAARLRNALRDAVAREDFEEAVRLRDRLRELEGGPTPP